MISPKFFYTCIAFLFIEINSPAQNQFITAGFSPDQQYIYVYFREKSDAGYKVYTLDLNGELISENVPKYSIAGNEHSFKNIVLYDDNDSIYIWDIDKDKLLFKQIGDYGNFSNNGHYFFIQKSNREWDLSFAKQRKVVDFNLKVYDLESGELIFNKDTRYPFYHIILYDDTKKLYAVYRHKISIWNIINGKKSLYILRKPKEGIRFTEIQFSPDGKYAITTGYGEEEATIWDLQKGAIKTIQLDRCYADYLYGVNFSKDSKYFSIGLDCNQTGVWDIHTGSLIHRLDIGSNIAPIPAHFSRDNKWLATSTDMSLKGDIETVKIWDAKTGMLTWTKQGGFSGFHNELPIVLICDNSGFSLLNVENGKTIFEKSYP